MAMVAFEVHAQLFANNDISCNVIFRPAHSCPSFPVNSYLLLLRSISSGMIINLTVDFNETKLVLGPQDGLEDNQKYVYTITAINSIGISTSEERSLGKCFMYEMEFTYSLLIPLYAIPDKLRTKVRNYC